jgi:hypothetical protein
MDSLCIVFQRNFKEINQYLNGLNIGNSFEIIMEGDLSTVGFSLGIGANPNNLDSSFYFKGEIDEVRIWNLSRTQSQITSTMNVTLGPEYYSTSDSGLVAYYRFDQLENLGIGEDGFQDNIRDLSIKNNHADIIGIPILVVSEALTKVNEYFLYIPYAYLLKQNYPNPFNSSTTISYSIFKSDLVVLKIYDLQGREIQTLVKQFQKAGDYMVDFNTNDLSSGFYFYKLQAGNNYVETKKMLLIR